MTKAEEVEQRAQRNAMRMLAALKKADSFLIPDQWSCENNIRECRETADLVRDLIAEIEGWPK